MMNKKILLSTAAAALLAVSFTGCGSDSLTSGISGAIKQANPSDGMIYGASMTCTGATAVINDDNQTFTLTGDNPGTCTVTGGSHKDASVASGWAPNYATLTMTVPDRNETIYSSPITTLRNAFLGTGTSDAEKRIAEKKVISFLGVNPAGLTDAQLATAMNANPMQLADAGVGFTLNSRANMVALYVMMAKVQENNGTVAEVTAALKNIPSSSTALTAYNAADINASFNTYVTSVTPSVLSAIAQAMTTVQAAVNAAGSLDAAEAIADGAIAQMVDFNASVAGDLATLAADINTKVTNIQAAIKTFYISDVNQSLQTADRNVSENVMFGLKDRNLGSSDSDKYTADISIMFQNEGNSNYSFKTVLKDITLTESSDNNYSFSMAGNSNASFAGTSFTGGVMSVDTKEINTTSDGDNNVTLTNAIDTNASYTTDINLTKVFKWTQDQLIADTNTNISKASEYGANSNWTTKVILNIDDNASVSQSINKINGTNLSGASTSSITVDKARTGAILFNGSVFE